MSQNESASATLFQRVSSVINTSGLPSLGPEMRENIKSVERLREEFDPLFSQTRVSKSAQELIRAAALLWHDHLHEAHTIVQDDDSAEAAFIHGIMHRREPDYSNAKYWFRRVGQHVTFPQIAVQVGRCLSQNESELAGRLVKDGTWHPMAFIDACEKARQGPPGVPTLSLLQQLQKVEFDTLLEHLCTRGLAGPG